MKIGIYSPYLDTLTGGEKYIFTAASCLSGNHKVTIFWDDGSIIKKASEKFNLDLEKVSVEENIFRKDYSFIKRFFATLKYDRIIVLSDGSIPIVGSKKLLIHFQFPVEWVNTNSFVFLFKKSRISRIICNSQFTKKFIDRKFSVSSYVLYPPAAEKVEPVKGKEKLILTVGRFSMIDKNSDFKKLKMMIKAFKKFKKRRLKGWEMAIVTSVREDQKLNFEDFLKSIKSKHVNVYRNANYDTIQDLYKRASIYWHAAGFAENLSKHPERAEHFGISTVEAMSYGAVPIVINAGGQTEIVKDSENGFLWESEDELIEKTHKVALDKNLLGKLSENARISSQRFTKSRFCEELNHLIW